MDYMVCHRFRSKHLQAAVVFLSNELRLDVATNGHLRDVPLFIELEAKRESGDYTERVLQVTSKLPSSIVS